MDSKSILSLQITTRKLNNSNYLQWSRAVEVYLIGQGYENHRTSEPPEEGIEEAKTWRKVDNQIISLLWNSMEPQIADVCSHHTVKEIWDFVKIIFLAGLKSDYEHVKTQILAGASLPFLVEVYRRVSQYSPGTDASHDKSALAIQSSQLHDGTWSGGIRVGRGGRGDHGGRGGRGGRGSRHCTYCGRDNHTREYCWKLNGEPPKVANNAYTFSEPESSGNVSISQEEYSKLLQLQSAQQASLPTASLAQLGFEDKEDDWKRT
ncbi:Retrovirus-related Pol polyprotein from transposon TNT 1-94 [Quillaja saponaria]|uniref:Retrovirus-related Pol polyprotein from transposon TNT 1-94 n=1 Tax=Quillaja saponaria TaxID=32244 RepID=A0AAD7LE11_QUISA|nr:Retrovirus-related Pol polyprotein from transposon TNT 1-94 [Quillaja saponaria]